MIGILEVCMICEVILVNIHLFLDFVILHKLGDIGSIAYKKSTIDVTEKKDHGEVMSDYMLS